MFIDMIIFSIIAKQYVYIEKKSNSASEEEINMDLNKDKSEFFSEKLWRLHGRSTDILNFGSDLGSDWIFVRNSC